MSEDTDFIDRKAIEEKGLLKFKEYLVYSKCMSQYLSENDKEPVWDGHIYLFKDARKVKDNLLGRVPVQVKSTEVQRFKHSKFKFPIDTVDLKSYLLEPTVFIVCQVKKDSTDRELFFRFLLPETVKKILGGHPNQASISVSMKSLPSSDVFEEKLVVFLADREKQLNFANKRSPSIQAVMDRGLKLQVTAPRKYSDVPHLFSYLSQNETFLYAVNDEEFGTEVPIDGGPFRFSFSKYENEPIRVADRIFFSGYTNEIKNGRNYIVAENGMLTMDLPIQEEDKRPVQLTITCPSNSLDDLIKQGEFVMALKDHHVISIGKHNINIGDKGLEGDLAQLEKNLANWKRLKETLDILHVKKAFEVDKIKPENEGLLSLIIDCIHEKRRVSLDNPPEPGVYLFEVANLKLLLYFVEVEPRKYYVGDIFDLGIHFKVSTDDGVSWTNTCAFSYLRDDNLWQSCDNIDFSKIVDCYAAVELKENGFEKVVEDDLSSISYAITALEETNSDANRVEDLKDAYKRLRVWLDGFRYSFSDKDQLRTVPES